MRSSKIYKELAISSLDASGTSESPSLRELYFPANVGCDDECGASSPAIKRKIISYTCNVINRIKSNSDISNEHDGETRMQFASKKI